ncbi:MAG TPA: hypothetical protein VI306_17035 [Pyrinomonadaceae bacterium]
MNRLSTEEVLNKAYRLAYFLHQDKGTAIRIVADATLKLNVAMAVQSKRLYYVPVGRFSRGDSRRTDAIRNKTLFSDLHLLQRLIYGESEPYEHQKERVVMAGQPGVCADCAPASEEDLLVYFVKHLVRITTKRNAFYVTLGISRLLHNYSTFETMEIYNAVIGEPERVKDDYYYRSRKAVLMHEMLARFGELIRACRQQRGEERFETQPGSEEQQSLVRECLRLFTPWDTECSVPRDFNPLKTVIASLTSKSIADENELEVNRIHAILHPNCFERLIAAFGYRSPQERMELPRFFSNQTNDQSRPGRRGAPAELSSEELAEINHILDEQAGRRRRSLPTGVIRIVVDGIERGTLNPAEQSNINFSVKDDAEIIEVKTTDSRGGLLLATHLLTSLGMDHDAPTISSIQLEGGQKLSLSITRTAFDVNGGSELLITFRYRETNPLRVAHLWWQRLKLRPNPGPGGVWVGARISASLIVAGCVSIICLASYLGYMELTSRQTNGQGQVASVQTTPPNQSGPISGSSDSKAIETLNSESSTRVKKDSDEPDKTAAKITGPAATRRPKSDRATVAKTPSSPGPDVVTNTSDEDLTRSGSVVADLRLQEVKKIYIEMRGDAVFDQLRSKLVEDLDSSGVVAITTDADEADAALKIAFSENSAGGPQIERALLVNARGTVLWPKAGQNARPYSGEPTKVLLKIASDLLSEIRLARTGH